MIAALADTAVIQDSCPHADNTHIFNHTAVDSGIMANSDPVAHNDGIEIALAVEHGCSPARWSRSRRESRIHVAAQDGVHPHRGALAQDDVAEDLRRDVNVAIGRGFGAQCP
jgi:hypothetical protein